MPTDHTHTMDLWTTSERAARLAVQTVNRLGSFACSMRVSVDTHRVSWPASSHVNALVYAALSRADLFASIVGVGMDGLMVHAGPSFDSAVIPGEQRIFVAIENKDASERTSEVIRALRGEAS